MERKKRLRDLKYNYSEKKKIWIDSCNLCGENDWVILTHKDRYGFPAQTTACKKCGLVIINPRMTADEYGDFYAKWYRSLVSAFHGRTIDAQTVQSEQQSYAEEMERFVEPYLQDRDSQLFLDVGGSTGVVAVHFAQKFGLVPTVIDPAPDEIEEARRIGVKTITGLIEDWDPGSIRYDVVGMFQTIDHLLDVYGTLTKIREVIKPDGIFLVDIVDFRAAYLKNGSVEMATKIDHPFNLTEPVIESYLQRTGFSVLRRAYSEDHHLVAYVCKPVSPTPEFLPDSQNVHEHFRELRLVQNSISYTRGQS